MDGYILELRKLVGHRPLMMVGASVIVENGAGEILLQRRTDNGLWGYAGGSVEPGERTETAAARELREETGLIAEELELLGVFSGEKMHYVYPNGDEVHIVDVVYVCRKWRGELTPQAGEVEELRWFAPDALPRALNPPGIPGLERYRDTVKKKPPEKREPNQ